MIFVLFLRVHFSPPPRSHTPMTSGRNSPGRSAPASLLLIFHLLCEKNLTEPTGFSPSPTRRLGRWCATSPLSEAIYGADRDNASGTRRESSRHAGAAALDLCRHAREAVTGSRAHRSPAMT